MKERLDREILRRKMAKTRSQAERYVRDGKVTVGDNVILDPKEKIDVDSLIEINQDNLFVSRAGEKLSFALKEFGIDVNGKNALDIGSSTGGFTDCLLKNGAGHVFAVDVGKNQFDTELAKDSRITLFEGTDIRDVESFPRKIDIVVVDVSFISLSHIVPVIKKHISNSTDVILLIKPQFEMDNPSYLTNGIVTNEKYRRNAVDKIKAVCKKESFKILGLIDSPILGGSGNKEYLIHIKTK